jgi:hypothetical protein
MMDQPVKHYQGCLHIEEKKPPSIYFILAIELKKSRKEMILQSSNE